MLEYVRQRSLGGTPTVSSARMLPQVFNHLVAPRIDSHII